MVYKTEIAAACRSLGEHISFVTVLYLRRRLRHSLAKSRAQITLSVAGVACDGYFFGVAL